MAPSPWTKNDYKINFMNTKTIQKKGQNFLEVLPAALALIIPLWLTNPLGTTGLLFASAHTLLVTVILCSRPASLNNVAEYYKARRQMLWRYVALQVISLLVASVFALSGGMFFSLVVIVAVRYWSFLFLVWVTGFVLLFRKYLQPFKNTEN